MMRETMETKPVRGPSGLRVTGFAWILAAAMILPAVFASPAGAAECAPDGMSVRAVNPDPVTGALPPFYGGVQDDSLMPTPSELSALQQDAEALRYQQMQSLFDETTLATMDELTAEFLPFIVGDILYGGTAPVESGGDDTLAVAKETAKRAGVDDGELSAALLKTVLELAQGATPTLRTLIYLKEQSKHKDAWYFSISVRALDKCGANLGEAHNYLPIKDRQYSDDSGMYPLDLPLKQVTAEVSSINILVVSLNPYWCHSGWFSGKNYGCGESPTTGNVTVKYV
jgi:hypothetical protein